MRYDADDDGCDDDGDDDDDDYGMLYCVTLTLCNSVEITTSQAFN